MSERRRPTLISVLLLALLPQSSAFTPLVLPNTHTPAATRTVSTPTQHNAVDPHQVVDYAELLGQVSAHTSNMIADAASDAVASQQPTGAWGAYVNLFKSALSFLHSSIDQPLRSVGIDQTWGVAIALFTCSCRALLLPLSLQQSKGAEYMKALKPYMTEIKEKFKDNQDAQNRALGKLYEDANQNPLSGCFVSLAQIPIFLGLYRGVRLLALDGVLDEPFLFIPSLQGPVSPPDFRGLDWLLSGWSNVDGQFTPQLGWETTLAFLVMPVVLVLLQSFTMSTLQPPPDENATAEEKKQLESTQAVFKFLPLLIGFFSLQVPAGLTIYWFSSNIFTLTQSLGVKAYYSANPPEIELPEYWDQMSEKKDFNDMTPEERRKATEAGLTIGPSFEDLVNESKFHVMIEREPFRETTEAWKRVESSSTVQLPSSMEAWVSSGPTATHSGEAEEANGMGPVKVVQAEGVASGRDEAATTPNAEKEELSVETGSR